MEGQVKGARRAEEGRGAPVEESVEMKDVRSVVEWWEVVVRADG